MTAPEFAASRRFVDTRFGRVAHVDRGSGPVALFLHGLPLSGHAWRDVIEDLGGERRCLAPDSMGLGATEVAPGQRVSFAEQAKMLAAFLDALEIDRVDLVGNDTGAGIAQVFAATFPSRTRSLTLTNCEVHDLWPNPLLAGFYEGVASGAVVEGMKAMLGDVALARRELGRLVYEDPDRAFTAETVEISLAPIVSSTDRTRLFRELCDWKVNRAELVAAAPALRASGTPSQVVWGDGDVVFDTGPSLAWLQANLGGLRKTTVVPRGMLFFPEEHPRLMSVLLREFWESASR